MREKRTRAVRYIRVSRSDQRPELQSDETEQMIERRGWMLVDTYVDHGVSGSRERRPQLDRLLDDARHGRFDVLVVYKADRLFRSLRHMVVTLDELAALRIAFASATEPFDTTTPSGTLLFHLVSAFAQFERSLLIERTRAGLAAAKRRGVRLGRPSIALDIEKARQLRADGKPLREVARALHVGLGTLHRALTAGDASRQSDVPETSP